MFWIGLVIGFFIGSIIALFLHACLIIAKNSDERIIGKEEDRNE